MKKIRVLVILVSLIIFSGLSAFKSHKFEDDYWLNLITNRFMAYIQKYHQNNVYLQTDKNEYETGETIYYKAYILNNAEKIPEKLVKNLYVELVSPNKHVSMSRLLKIVNGQATGDFPVLDTIYTGMYELRAYTENMKNAGSDYLFSKEIRINHPQKVFYNKEFHKKAKKIKKNRPELDLQFFPEGGEMIDKIETIVAFKAIDQNGNSIDVEGEIYSGKKKLISQFKSKHLGMGKFELIPEHNQKYYALVRNHKGKTQRFNLPEVKKEGYSLRIGDEKDLYSIQIYTNKKFENDPVAKTVYLIVQSGGKIYSAGKHILVNNKISVRIGKKILPSGVTQFTLFDGKGQPYCERLVFTDHQDKLLFQTNMKNKRFKKRSKIEFDIEIKNPDEEKVAASISVSVRQKQNFGKDAPTIRTYLLLQSELKGRIENPEYYFNSDPEVMNNLDLLMLTQGWRKFLWRDILSDSIFKPEFPIETDLRVTGRVTKYLFDISVPDAILTMTMLNKYNDIYKTVSGKKGYFEYTGLEFSDTMDVLIEVRTQNNKKNVLILVDEPKPVNSIYYPFSDFYLDSLSKRRKPEYKKFEEELPDPNKPEDFKIHSNPDQVVKFTDQMTNSGQNVLDILESRVPGLQVDNNQATMRGPSSLFMSNEPLYLLDGVPVDFGTIQTMNPLDVEYVDILKGPSAAIYGIRGSNGVIAVYTKKGFYYKRGEIHFKMLGYHTPKMFYMPKYTTENENNPIADLRKTIFWSPNLKPDEQGNVHVEFYQSDLTGEFEIVIEGMDMKGKTGSFIDIYTVEDEN